MRFTTGRRFGNNLQSRVSLASGEEEHDYGNFQDFGTWRADSTGVMLDMDADAPRPWYHRIDVPFLRLLGFAHETIPFTFAGDDHLSFEGESFVRVPE